MNDPQPPVSASKTAPAPVPADPPATSDEAPGTPARDYQPSKLATTWAGQLTRHLQQDPNVAAGPIDFTRIAFYFDECVRAATSTLMRFPIQDGPNIPWPMAERAYITYAKLFGRSQTIERLAERGGFGQQEFACLFHGHMPQQGHQQCIDACDGFRTTMDSLKEEAVFNYKQCTHWRHEYERVDAQYAQQTEELGKVTSHLYSISMERDRLRQVEECTRLMAGMLRSILDLGAKEINRKPMEPIRFLKAVADMSDSIDDQLDAVNEALAAVPSPELCVATHKAVQETTSGMSETMEAVQAHLEKLSAAYAWQTKIPPAEAEMVVRKQTGGAAIFFRKRVPSVEEQAVLADYDECGSLLTTSSRNQMNLDQVRFIVDTYRTPLSAKQLAGRAGLPRGGAA